MDNKTKSMIEMEKRDWNKKLKNVKHMCSEVKSLCIIRPIFSMHLYG